MAYAAVISLKNTLYRLVNSPQIPTLAATIELVYEELDSLQKVLERLDSNIRSSRDRLNALDAQIRVVVYNLEDALERHFLNHHDQKILSQSDDRSQLGHEEVIRQEVNSLLKAMKKMKEEYLEELDEPSPEEEEVGVLVSSSSGIFDGKKSNVNIRGLSEDKVKQLKDELTERKPYEIDVISVFGKAGSGRSIMADYAFYHPSVRQNFDKHVWVTVGPKYQLKDILLCLLFQVLDHGRQGNYKLFSEEKEEEEEEYLAQLLCTNLKGGRYLIALDNVCDSKVWDYLRRFFPEEYNGSRILLTTSVWELVAESAAGAENKVREMKVVDEEESWDLLRELVFGQGSCPPQLEEAGKKIAKNCQGRLVEIAKVARSLSKAQKETKHWNEVAAEGENCVFTDAYDELSEISRTIEDLELGNSFCGDDDFHARTDFGRIISEMPELYKVIEEIVRYLGRVDSQPPRLPEIFSLTGMAGIGKTTFAKEIFEDQSTLSCFDHHVWITLGPKYLSERILVDILAQIDPGVDKMHMKGEEMIVEHFRTLLSGKRCLLVLDDVWNKEALLYVNRLPSNIKFEVLLTTRLQTLVPGSDKVYEMNLLNKEQSWRLLCDKVFAEKSCPPELHKAGKMIAESCEGLPLLIVAVASLLSEGDMTPEFWNKVAQKENSLFERAYDKIMKVLFSSYEYLPQHLKACFLYMGVFPLNHEIPSSKLFKLWSLEGILEPSFSGTLEDLAMKYLKELVSRSLVIVLKEVSYLRIDTSSLHSVFWHLCTREARKTKFFNVLNRQVDGLEDCMESQRRLCIQNNILFGIKYVYDSMASISTARSLLCTGPPHQYPVPICFGLRLLRLLDALTIHLYKFPKEVLNLVLLRYLALTCERKPPSSISKLRNLECLIIRRLLSTKINGSPSYLPMEIWDMKELKHLQVLGFDLPDPCGNVLPNLLTLLDMSAHSCTKGVFQGTPHLRKLGIRIELVPDASECLFSFDHISHLNELQSLECIIVNPELNVVAAPPPPSLSMLPLGLNLKELSLSGLGYPWKRMKTIALLPCLEVLKLQCYAFRGPKWEMRDGEFTRLRYLLLEDTDLVHWTADVRVIWFWSIILRHCYKLKEIPRLSFISKIEVVDCNPLISKEIPGPCLVKKIGHIHSSWG